MSTGRQKDRHVTARHTQTDRQQVFVRCIALIGSCNISAMIGLCSN